MNREEAKKKAEALVARMTLEEKASQLRYDAPAIKRLGIPAYNWWNEGLHGVARAGQATVFPQAIGMAAAFDRKSVAEMAGIVATEGRAKYNAYSVNGDRDIYKGLTVWSPNVNIFRDPRWGRGHETYGEDPYLTKELGVSFVKALQGNGDTMKAAACAKHFAVHSGPEALRHEFDAEASAKDMEETYLPAFEGLVKEAKVEAVMGAYNRTNGEPCCGSPTLQKKLRGEWKFQGYFVSDCWAIRDFHEGHHVTGTAIESVAMAMNNGCDLNCGTLFGFLVQAVRQGLVKEERLDEAVTNLFMARMKLGVFDKKEENPYDKIPYLAADSREMKKLNEAVARRTVVLLKNKEHILPLDKNKIKTIGVIGPNADSRRALVGNYEGTASRYITVLEGIEDYVGDDVRVLYSEGCHLYKDRTSNLAQENDRMSEVLGVCKESDVVVAVLGLDAGIEGEEGDAGNEYGSGDKPDLNLPGLQEEILEAAVSCGKPVILVLLSGSALAVNWADEHVDAIVQGWYPGARGGAAIADILFGEANPEGKLPVTFYRTTEELPDFEDYSMQGRTYRYMEQEALYPFGYGLSYTEYAYQNVRFLEQEPVVSEGVTIGLSVKNTGKMDGTETVQVYVKAEHSKMPHGQLKKIVKLPLCAGEEKEINIRLESEAFMLYDENGEKILPSGHFEIFVGGMQPDSRSEKLTGKTVESLML